MPRPECFGHSIAKDLMTQSEELASVLSPEKLYQVSMDRLKVNFEVLQGSGSKMH